MANKVEYVRKYQSTRDAIMLRPSKADGAKVRKAAADAGKSVQSFVLEAVFEYIQNHAERGNE